MVWRNSIYDLDYYHPVKGIPCYCEELAYASDMILQAIPLLNASNSLTATLYVYTPDGLTQLENATTYFQSYFATDTSNRKYFNAQLKSFSPAMCNNKCFIIRLVITSAGYTIWDKWTERYCVNDCCDVVRGVSYSQDGVSTSSSPTLLPVPASPAVPLSECGKPLIRLISTFDCIDNFTGNFFGEPVTVISGTSGFNYSLTSSFPGRIVRRPREITREISYNCRLQKVESAATYLLEGFLMFPAWKMYEIEGQLHANNIYVDDFTSYNQYQYNGGTPFAKVQGANDCTEVFKLSTELNGCIQRQIFGCIENCSASNNIYFVIPENYAGNGFYDENGQFIASVIDGDLSSPYAPGLVQWLRSQTGITLAESISLMGFSCTPAAIIQVQGTGYLPSSIFMDNTNQRNRIYSIQANDTNDLCDYLGEDPCLIPVAGTVVISTMQCTTPTNDTVIIETITPDTLTVINYGDWVAASSPDTEASAYINQVTLSIETTNNTTITGMSGEDYALSAEPIVVISSGGIPNQTRVLNSDNSTLAAGITVVINTNGLITVTGTFTLVSNNELTLDFDNLVYSLT